MRDLRFLLKTHYTNSRALVIGINQYKNASPLSYAVSDAEELRDVLVSDLGFPKENILRSFMRLTADEVGLDERILFSLLDTAIRAQEFAEKSVIWFLTTPI